ncbi:MAG TPA: phosphonate ABC transporter, permease protein PhnE [Rhodospirillales bacterium]|nr:phosphonate ABC transporter, permease protein PhnE [Rhodospirillales bacterium]
MSTAAHTNPLRDPGSLARRYAVYGVVGALILAMTLHLMVFETNWRRMGSPSEIVETISALWPSLSYIPKIIVPLLETALMAFWGTLLAIIMSVPVAYLAATTTTPSMLFTFPIGRGLIVLSRSTHEIIFALIFVAALGLGPLPGILAIAFRAVGFMSKTTAEAIENVDRRPVEAIQATGAGLIARFVFAVVPQVLPIFLGNAIFQFDINVRRAAILGMVGAGGIGLHFVEQMKTYNYNNAGACVLAVVVLVVGGEIVSNRLRTKLIAG